MDDELLRPSLSETKSVAILSSGALMAAAFFGGPLAVTAVAAMNSYSLNRLQRDWAPLIGILVIGMAAIYVFSHYLFEDMSQGGRVRLATRAAGFACFGLAWLLHKKELRAQATMGMKPRSPWGPVTAACLLGIAVNAWYVLANTTGAN